MKGGTRVPDQLTSGAVTWQPLERPGRVLLVEDDAGDALLVEELLADSGLEVDLRWVRSLNEARAALAEQTPQCVLLDLHLPDAQGLGALAAVLEVAGGAAVVVLTGLAEEKTGLAAVTAGAQDYLVKGRVEPELLGRALRYAVQRKQTEQAAAALQAERLRAQENARLERGLLPSPLLGQAPVQVDAGYQPGRASALLGGDFYDVVEADDGRVHAVIGDVSGHGPDEAALGVCLRIAWRTLVLSGAHGDVLLRQMERILVAERASAEIFATVCTLSMSPDGSSAEVVRAGHPGLLMRSGGGVEWVEPPGGPALGLLPGLADWTPRRVELPPGAALVLFTDGLFERRLAPPSRERLGESGLLAMARGFAALPGPEFVDALISDASDTTAAPTDDIAVVHLGWESPGV
jgi:serine phosphatase RsbU (regulator of sigma subunit)